MKQITLFILFFCLIFVNGFQLAFSSEWQRVYLATFPRSGNHWARYLVEEASNIVTSSVYPDPEPPAHMDKIFPWGGYCSPHGYEGNRRYPSKKDFVLVKTHFPGTKKGPCKFDNLSHKVVIRIVRHPVDSCWSRYVKNPHGTLQEIVPSKRVKEMIKLWRQFQTYWNKQKNVITIRYEDMLKDPAPALRIICDALEYNVSDEDIARAVAKYPPEGHVLKHVNRFTKEDLKLFHKELDDLLIQFDYHEPF
jgi:hypothetical protein